MNRYALFSLERLALAACVSLLAACATLAPGYVDLSLEKLFNAERAFAADAYARGVRASFLAHFAPDAIVFQPGPLKYADLVEDRPASPDPLATIIEWGPQAGAVSRSGDLGFTTGPTRISNRRDAKAPVGYGYYFSVWSRAGGEWRVIVDAGVSQTLPPPQEGAPNMRTAIFHKLPAPLTDAQHAASRDALLAFERTPRAFGNATAGTLAFRDLLLPQTRWLRNDQPALVGKALADHVDREPAGRIEWTPIDGAIATSDDLAYTYGTSRRFVGVEAPIDGYYVHVWQRARDDAWKLLAAVSLPAG